MPTASTLTLGPIESPDKLKICQPYLMPFYITYSGPAPISTYLRVNPAKETVGAPEPLKITSSDSQITLDAQNSSSSQDSVTVEAAGMNMETDAASVPEARVDAAKEPVDAPEPPDTASSDAQTTSNTQVSGSSSNSVAVDAADVQMETDITPAPLAHVDAAKETVDAPEPSESVTSDAKTISDTQNADFSGGPEAVDPADAKMEIDATPTPVASSSHAKRVPDATTTRFISSFRGRTIQGLNVALPEGYVGVVLHGDDASDSTTRDKKGKGPETKTVKDTGKRSTRTRSKIVEDEPEIVDDEYMNVDADEETRALSVASQFSSFVLWHADHPVDEGRDEYLRSLSEWTQLARLIHEVED